MEAGRSEGEVRGRDPLANPEMLIRRIHSYVAYRIGDGPDAEDITSETFERALRRRSTYDPARGTPTAWLLGIARNCVSDAMRGRVTLLADPPDQPAEGDLEHEAVTRLTLAAAISSLDERDQDLLALRYGSDLTAKRIAEVLDLKTNAVEVALHRALVRLRDLLDPQASPRPSGSSSEAISFEP